MMADVSPGMILTDHVPEAARDQVGRNLACAKAVSVARSSAHIHRRRGAKSTSHGLGSGSRSCSRFYHSTLTPPPDAVQMTFTVKTL